MSRYLYRDVARSCDITAVSSRERGSRRITHRRADFHGTMSYALNVLAQGITELVRRDLMLQFQFS